METSAHGQISPEDFEFVASPEMPDGGTYRGEAASRFLTAWVESFEDHTITATEIVDGGPDKVFVEFLQRGRPRESPAVLERRWWMVITFRGGGGMRGEVLPERFQALEAAGLTE